MQNIQVSGDISLVEIAALKYGSVEVLFDLAVANGVNELESIPASGFFVLPDIDVKQSKAFRKNTTGFINHFVSALAEQALIDLAVAEGGSIEALFDAAVLNDVYALESTLIAKKDYLKPSVINATVVDRLKGIKPASANNVPDSQLPILLDGIDYWFIENDFIIS
ncbi:MAG: hypothetical protein C0459_03460 [Chitinophaga sp.]|jgi:hypothetical protein|nr:hypothetical protein [Chitinophaga sp.]